METAAGSAVSIAPQLEDAMFKTRESALSLLTGLFAVMTIFAHESSLSFHERDTLMLAFLTIFLYLALIHYAIIELRKKLEPEKAPGA
jgi:ABC-type transport system involved in cytochrome c biogenesis permease subunit